MDRALCLISHFRVGPSPFHSLDQEAETTMTTGVNPVLTGAEDLFKKLVWDNLVTAALTAFGVNFSVVRWVVGFFTDKIYEIFRTLFDEGALIFLNEAHKRAFDDATVSLKIIGQQKGIDSDEYKKAKSNAQAALSAFLKFNQ